MKNKEVIKIIKRLYSFTKEHFWTWGIIRFIGGFGSATLNLYLSKILGGIIDVVIRDEMEVLIRFILLLVFASVLRSILGYSNSLSHYRYSVLSGRKYREHAIDKVNRLPLSYYEDKHSGEIITKIMNDIDKIQVFYGNSIAGIWSYVPAMLIVGTIMLVSISWKLTLICMTIIPLVTYFLNKITLPIAQASQQIQKTTGELNSYLRDYLEGNDIYKVFDMNKTHSKKYDEKCDEIAKQSFKVFNRKSYMRGVTIFSGLFPWVLTYAIGGIYVSKGEITIGQLFAFSTIMQPYAGSFWKVAGGWADMVEVAGRAKNFFKLIDSKLERNDGKDYPVNKVEKIIEVQKLSFSYDNGIKLLDNCTFYINKGAKISLVGASGSGKTTVFKLLCGFYDNYRGKIKIAGHGLSDWKLSEIRKNISIVGQDIYLFNDSIMENIRYGNIKASNKDIVDAAKKAYAHDFILKTKDGYETVVGERGIRLSGGQKQRIAIARAILKDAPIILLDEPTSALDTKSEYYVQYAIENLEKEKTVLVVAHRLSTIINSDNIFVLAGGKIIEQGTHLELIAKGARYKKLYKAQVIEEEKNNEILIY